MMMIRNDGPIKMRRKHSSPLGCYNYHNSHHHEKLGGSFMSSSGIIVVIVCFLLSYDCGVLLLPVVVVVVVEGIEFNNQVMDRATDRLTDYMSIPPLLSQRMLQFNTIGGFPNYMNAMDRYFASQFMFVDYPNTIYYGLEDGTFLYYDPYFNASNYREPGNSGYWIDWDDQPTSKLNNSTNHDNYEKFFYTCIAPNGTIIECTMLDGQMYIDNCPNDDSENRLDCPLELAPCNISSPSSSSSFQNNMNCTNSSLCHNNDTGTIWCTNYTIKVYNATSTTSNNITKRRRGYIPRTKGCINADGLPEQTNGQVLVNISTMELGNCYSLDRTIIIQNNITGPYQSCQSNNNRNSNIYTTNNNASIYDIDGSTVKNSQQDDRVNCSTTFLGGYQSIQYDPRFRGWYMSTKQQQQPVWSDPYPFFTGNDIGITYSIPMYYQQEQQPHMKIFYGVIAVDYFLGKLRDFFTSEYLNTDMSLLIIEVKTPNYIIATSTGSLATKLVLKTNTSQLCTSTTPSSNCTIARISVMELTDQYNPMDYILKRAFFAQSLRNFPNSTLVNVKETDKIGSKAYISQNSLFMQQNLQWHVIVVMPMSRSTSDAILPSSNMFYVTIAIATIGFLACMFLFYFMFKRRNDKVMIHADWRFTCAFIFNCATLNLSTFALLGPNTDQLCMLRMWSFNQLFACALSPLFVKVWRMHRLLAASAGFKRMNVGHRKAFLYSLPIILLEAILLMMFSLVDPPRAVEDLNSGESGFGVQEILCAQQNNSFLITQVIFHGILIFIGCILAYQTRDLNPKFGEAKQLGFSMYNIAFTGIVIVLIFQLVGLDQVSKIILQAIGVVWASFFCSFAFVLPRLLEVQKETRTTLRNTLTFLATSSGHEVLGQKTKFSETSSAGYGVVPHGLDVSVHSESDTSYVQYGVRNAITLANAGLSSSFAIPEERHPNAKSGKDFLQNRESKDDDDSISSDGSVSFALGPDEAKSTKTDDGMIPSTQTAEEAALMSPRGGNNRLGITAIANRAIGSVRNLMFSSSNFDSPKGVASQRYLVLTEDENRDKLKGTEEIDKIVAIRVTDKVESPYVSEKSSDDDDSVQMYEETNRLASTEEDVGKKSDSQDSKSKDCLTSQRNPCLKENENRKIHAVTEQLDKIVNKVLVHGTTSNESLYVDEESSLLNNGIHDCGGAESVLMDKETINFPVHESM